MTSWGWVQCVCHPGKGEWRYTTDTGGHVCFTETSGKVSSDRPYSHNRTGMFIQTEVAVEFMMILYIQKRVYGRGTDAEI